MNSDLVDAYTAHLRARRMAERTVSSYHDTLTRANAELPCGIEAANTVELQAWLTRRPWRASTQSLYTTILAGFFGWALAHDHLDHDPAARLPRPQIPRRLPHPATDDQVATILTTTPQPVRLWAAIAAYAGARACEIARVDRDRDITGGYLRLWGKGAKERVVPVHPHLRGLLDAHHGPVATIAAQPLAVACWRAFRAVGVATSLHPLRAWFATTLVANGVDSRVVQELLGHASLETTQVYTLVAPRQLNAAVARLPVIGVAAAASPGDRDPGR